MKRPHVSMLKSELNALLRETTMAANTEIGRFRCQSSVRCAVRFQRHLRGVVVPFEEVVYVLTETVLCLKRQYLLNICKLKRQTMIVRYSDVAIVRANGSTVNCSVVVKPVSVFVKIAVDRVAA